VIALRKQRRLGRAFAACGLLAFAACNQTPTEITPLPRALGEVEAVRFAAENLVPLDPNTGAGYVLWGLRERNQASRLGRFFIDATTGEVVDASGNPLSSFTTDEFAMRTLQGVLVTIETAPDTADTPVGMQILSGTFIDRVAEVTVPISSAIDTASGTLRIFTPTDGPNTNENSGFWMVDPSGNPSLDTPDTTAALIYETFIEINGLNLNVGRFDFPSEADDLCRYCANFDEFPAPERPGEDLLLNAPEGLFFPRDLSGAIVRISLEGRFNDLAQQSQLIVLEAMLPVGLTGGEIVSFQNLAASFPSGSAVLY
jgi:hypothetical protein